MVRRRLPAGVAWAWLSLVLFLPVAGTVLYMIFGEFRQAPRRQRRLRRAQDLIAKIVSAGRWDEHLAVPGEDAHLIRAYREMMGFPALDGNLIELLGSADRVFESLLADIRYARVSIDFEFYIWFSGGRADQVAQAMAEAAARGVRCRILLDAVGSAAFVRGPGLRALRGSGIDVVVALPSGIWRSFFARPDLRIHRKIVVVDSLTAYTGSMNLADPLHFKSDSDVSPWVDAMARIQGPMARALSAIFVSDWCAETGELAASEVTPGSEAPAGEKRGGAILQCLPSGPAVKDSTIEQALIMALNSARKSIILTTPYFVPGEALIYALVGAARRGVRTTLIVPERVDSRLTHFASRSFFGDLLEAGVRVALYRPGLLHTKSVTVDGRFSLFGSLNLDPRSLRINYEITIAAFDRDFTLALEALQSRYLDRSTVMDRPGDLRSKPREIWLGDLARLAGPLL